MRKRKEYSGNSLDVMASISCTEKQNAIMFKILRQRMF